MSMLKATPHQPVRKAICVAGAGDQSSSYAASVKHCGSDVQKSVHQHNPPTPDTSSTKMLAEMGLDGS